MTSHLEWIEGYQPFETPISIRLADERIVPALGSGTISTSFGILHNVLYVPDMKANLLSMSSATKSNIEFRTNSTGMWIYYGSRFKLKALQDNNVYWLNLEVIPPELKASAAVTLDHWHQRLAHMPKDLILKMMRNNIVDGIQISTTQTHDCVDCKLNKCNRVSHSTRSSMKAVKPGQSLHFDVLGPIKPTGLNDERFVLVMKDEFSSYRMTTCLKAKSKVPETAKIFVTKAELETGNSVLRVTSDRGTEFTSERFTIFLQFKGIEHVLSAAYVPQQNGTAERENRFLLDQSRTLLNSAKLQQELWPEAVNASTYASNRGITKNREKTPYELWFNKKPNVKNLRIFGQHASVLKPDHLRSKFETKGSLMYFVGYTDSFNTFRFYNPVTKGLVTSCDVLFIDRFGPISQLEIDGSQGQTSGRVEIATNDVPQTSPYNFDNTEPGDHAGEIGNQSETIEPVTPQDQGRNVETMSEHGSRYMDAEDVSSREGPPTENVEASQNRPEAHQQPFDIEEGDIIFRRHDFFRRSTPRQPSSTEMSTISEVPSHSVRTPTAPLLSSSESLEQRITEQPRVEQNVVSVQEGTAEQAQDNDAENRPSLRRSQRSTSSYNYNDLV